MWYLVSKRKNLVIIFFGLIFAYTYFYVAWGNNFLGEMNTVLYVYIPSQFIGYFMWKQHMQNDNGGESVIAKALTPKGWAILLVSVGIGTFCFVQALKSGRREFYRIRWFNHDYHRSGAIIDDFALS